MPTFDTVYDAVDDLGMDDTGSTANDTILQNNLSSGTLIEFPAGEFLFEDENSFSNLDNVGLRGVGNDTKFTMPEDNAGAPDPANYDMFVFDGGTGILLEDFEIHQTTDKETGASIIAWADDDLIIRGIHWQGWNPIDSYAKGTCLYPGVANSDGFGIIEKVTIDGGGVADQYPSRRMGMLFQGSGRHEGTIKCRHLHFEELGSSALRATGCPGTVEIEDCYAENIDNGSFRFGGGSNGNSYCERCVVVLDPSLIEHDVLDEGYQDPDGIRLDGSGNAWQGATVRDCDLQYLGYPTNSDNFVRGAIDIPNFGDHQDATIENCRFQIDIDDCPAIQAQQVPNDGPITVRNVHIQGSSGGNFGGAQGVINFIDRPNSSVEDSHIDMPSCNEHGVAAYGDSTSGITVTDTEIDVATTSTQNTSDTNVGSNPNPTNQKHTEAGVLDTVSENVSELWTAKKSKVGNETTITATVTSTIPSGTSVAITLFEDVGGNGVGPNTDFHGNNYNNNDSATLTGGTESIDFTGFDGGGSTNDYWMQVYISGDGTATTDSPTFSALNTAQEQIAALSAQDADRAAFVGQSTTTKSGGMNATTVNAAAVNKSGREQLASLSSQDADSSSLVGLLSQMAAIISQDADRALAAGSRVLGRTATTTGDGEADSNAELTKVFPSQSSVNLNFTLVNEPVLGFANEWAYEDSEFDNPTAFTVIIDMVEANPFTIRIQYRESEEGSADYTTDPEEVTRHNQPITFPELGDAGYYRLIVSDLRPGTYLRAITWGPVRY